MSKKEKAAPLEEEKETAAAPAEDVPKSGETEETFAVTKEQMEKMEGLAKELADLRSYGREHYDYFHRFGFVPAGFLPNCYGEGHHGIIMVKELTPEEGKP